MELRQQIDQQMGIKERLHHADEVLLNTPLENIDMSVLRSKAAQPRLLRLIQAADYLHERAILMATQVDDNVELPPAVVDPRIIGGEAAGRQGGRRAAARLMRKRILGGVAVGPIEPSKQDDSLEIGHRITVRPSAAILTL